MDIEMIAPQDHLVGIGGTGVKKMLELVRPGYSCALCRDVECPSIRQRLSAQQHVGRPVRSRHRPAEACPVGLAMVCTFPSAVARAVHPW